MTNSFQPQARPVNTFVQPSVVAPSSGVDDLLKILQSVNPGLNKFLDNRIDTAIEEEEEEGMELAIEHAAKDFKDYTKSIKKKDGEEAARQLIGGSIFANRAYQKTKVDILGNNLKSKIENSYTTTRINDQPLSAYSFESVEFQGWLEEQRTAVVEQLEDINPTYVRKYFLPKLADSTGKITSHHIQQHKEYKFEELKSLTTPLVKQVITIPDPDTAKTLIQGYEISIKNLGISGEELNKINKSIVDALSAEAEAAALEGDEERADEIMEKASVFPYGPGGQLTLKDHPDFKKKSNDIERKASNISYQNAKRKEIEDKRAKEEERVNGINNYFELLSNGETDAANESLKELLKSQPEFAPKIMTTITALEGPEAREESLELTKRIIDGGFENRGTASAAVLQWFNKTSGSSDNIRLAQELMKYAERVENGQFTRINKALTELKSQIGAEFRKDGNSNVFGQLNGTASKDLNNLINRASDELRLWRLGLDKDPTPTEEFEKIKEIRDKYLEEARKKTNPLGDQLNNQQEEPLPGVPDVSPLGDQSSNPIIDAANQIANALTGTAPAAAGTLEEAQERGELMTEEPQIKTTGDGVERMNNNFPTIYKLAKEVGIKFPEIVAAQFSLESDHGKKASGKNNYLGIKATQKEIADGKATLVQTGEVIDGKEVVIKDYFKDFDTLKDMLLHYKEQWNDNYKDRKGTSTSSTVEEAVKLLKSNGYATDPDYVKKILNIIKNAKAEPALF